MKKNYKHPQIVVTILATTSMLAQSIAKDNSSADFAGDNRANEDFYEDIWE